MLFISLEVLFLSTLVHDLLNDSLVIEAYSDSPEVEASGGEDSSVAGKLLILDAEDDIGEAVIQTQALELRVDLFRET